MNLKFIVIALMTSLAVARAQTSASTPRMEFEVATIKPSQYAGGVSLKLNDSGLFTAVGPSLIDLIKFAYDVHARQIIGGPSWLETAKYDVTGKPDQPGKPKLAQLKAMVRKLLEDRFQLTFRYEKKELPVYAITVAKSGPKLTRNESDPNGLWGGAGIGPRSLAVKNITMAEFAALLQAAGSISDRPVVDQTGLGNARYDLALKWMPDANPAPPGRTSRTDPVAENPDAPSLFTAFQEQLGLKLGPTKAQVEVLVIDHAERPSEN